jgi:P27 family predicted phage terminase small subunit
MLHGDRKDRVNFLEPKPRDVLPEPPIDMTPAGREIWEYTIKELGPMRVATAADRDALVAYCEAVAMHRRAAQLLATQDILVEGQKGNIVRNPAVQMMRDAAMTMKAFAAEFGLTPRARAEMKMPEAPKNDQRQQLLS